jgi:aquaporin Z
VRALFAEAIGTFALVFVGTGAIVVNDASGALTPLGVALAFGLAVGSMIFAVGDVSGAHFNPAVTLGFWAARRFPASRVAPFVGAQLAGALLASSGLRLLFPAHPDLGATRPAGGVPEAMALEVVLSFFLVFVILSVTTGAKERGVTAALAIGGTVAMGALFGGPISGASMNPARSLAPALLSGELSSLWLYLVAPVLGAGLAVLGCRCTREPGCCSTSGAPAGFTGAPGEFNGAPGDR